MRGRRRRGDTFGAVRLDSAARALWLTGEELDAGFEGAARDAAREVAAVEKGRRDAWEREHGAAVVRRRAVIARERGWADSTGTCTGAAATAQRSNNNDVDGCWGGRGIKARRGVKRLAPIVPKKNKHRPSPFAAPKAGKRRRASGGLAQLEGSGLQRQELEQDNGGSAGVTYDHSGTSGSFESVLQKCALDDVLLREGYLGELRAMFRVYDPDKEAQVDLKRLDVLLEKVRSTTLAAVLGISKWEACFVEPRPFVFRGTGQEPVDYLLATVSTLDFLRLRPTVVAAFNKRRVRLSAGGDNHGSGSGSGSCSGSGNGSGKGSSSLPLALTRNPLLLLQLPTVLEAEAMAILKEHENNFGLLKAKRCTWCGLLPAVPKGGGREIVACRDTTAACGRGLFCDECIKANCGGSHALKLIKGASTWACFLCARAKLQARAAERQRAKDKAREAVRYKKEKQLKEAARARLRRCGLPSNVKRRKRAARFLGRQVLRAREVCAARVAAAIELRALAGRAQRVLEERQGAAAWLAQRTAEAREACHELALAHAQAEKASEERQRRRSSIVSSPNRASMAALQRRTSSVVAEGAAATAAAVKAKANASASATGGSSLDLFEADAEQRSRQEKGADGQQPGGTPIDEQSKPLDRADQDALAALDAEEAAAEEAEPWLKFGARANLRCAIRVLFSEVCMVAIKSTEKNPEIVEVTTFVPSEQLLVPRLLMHKSQVTMDQRAGPLRAALRARAHAHFTARANAWTREHARKAMLLLEHNRKQWHLRQGLTALGAKSVRHNNNQKDALAWLRRKSARVMDHLAAQLAAKKHFGFVTRRAWKQQAKQQVARQELVAMAQKVQTHLVSQRAILWELFGKANHVKVHLLAQQRAKQQLQRKLKGDLAEQVRKIEKEQEFAAAFQAVTKQL